MVNEEANKARLNISFHEYKVQWEAANILRIREIEIEKSIDKKLTSTIATKCLSA